MTDKEKLEKKLKNLVEKVKIVDGIGSDYFNNRLNRWLADGWERDGKLVIRKVSGSNNLHFIQIVRKMVPYNER